MENVSAGCYNREAINANSILLPLLFEPEQHGIMKMISYHQFLPQQIDAQFIWSQRNAITINITMLLAARIVTVFQPTFFAARAALLSWLQLLFPHIKVNYSRRVREIRTARLKARCIWIYPIHAFSRQPIGIFFCGLHCYEVVLSLYSI